MDYQYRPATHWVKEDKTYLVCQTHTFICVLDTFLSLLEHDSDNDHLQGETDDQDAESHKS